MEIIEVVKKLGKFKKVGIEYKVENCPFCKENNKKDKFYVNSVTGAIYCHISDGKESTRTAINELIEKGYIQRTRVHENGKFKRYDYTVFEKPNFQKSENQNTEIQKSENHTLINTEFKKELNVKNTKSINIHFDEFWKIYKKKIEKAKCLEKWNKLNNKDRELIIKHIPVYEKSLSDIKYLKNPMNYLNSKMWLDDFEEVQIKEKKSFTRQIGDYKIQSL